MYVYVCMYVCVYVGMCMYACVFVCMYICMYVVCPKSKCTDFLFKYLLDSPEIISYLLQSMTLGKLHSGTNVFFSLIIAVLEVIFP